MSGFLSSSMATTMARSYLQQTSIKTVGGLKLNTRIMTCRLISTGTATEFKSLENFNPNINRAIEDLKFTVMTEVQEKVLPYLLKPGNSDSNLLVQAKTGTGKTVAFLIPSIQRAIEFKNNSASSKSSLPRKPTVLIISPTRELARQISDDAARLIARLPEHENILAKTVVGGVNFNEEAKRTFRGQGVDLLVATPGRLLQYIESEPRLFNNVKVRIYDEADTLLDQGFKYQLDKINAHLKASADIDQSLMFSATVSDAVKSLARQDLGKDHHFITTITKDTVPTHALVPQHLVNVERILDQPEALYALLKKQLADRSDEKFKAIVFCKSSKEVKFLLALFSKLLESHKIDLFAISGRDPQGRRFKTMENFKGSDSGIIFATDVIARGIDIKGVTHVYQLGQPKAVAEYIHRIGRTGRAGKSGEAVIILSNLERPFITKLLAKNINFTNQVDYIQNAALRDHIKQVSKIVQSQSADDNMLSGFWLSVTAYYKATYGRSLTLRDLLKDVFDSLPYFGLETDRPVITAVQRKFLRKVEGTQDWYNLVDFTNDAIKTGLTKSSGDRRRHKSSD
ncbi:P-loop containing nucleoside triphosphate hydrolase protein [Lipomyces japonicus]|uniref:P-loop containing nucleoside triphosphate hydrolase protein n=1 Tax=Lipomyces japonicus TaxID=56871 RepID=UPI0034CF9127